MPNTSDSDAIAKMRTKSDTSAHQCIVGAKADELEPKDLATFNEAMWGPPSDDINASAIMDHARAAWGWSFSTTTLRVHRRKGCSCDFT